MSDEEEDPLRSVSQKIDETQTLYEDLAHIATPQIPCPECGGRGTQNYGSLGAVECFRCDGSRMVARPGAEPIDMPDFATLRARLEGADPPSLAEIKTLHDEGVAIARSFQPQLGTPAISLLKSLGRKLLGRGTEDDDGR